MESRTADIRKTEAAWLLWALLGLLPLRLMAQAADGIYTCTDGKGRKLTSDRPIPECIDRTQRVLNPSGTVRTLVGPTLTGPERAAQEAKQRREAEERARQAEEKRRERALLTRYPNKDLHDRERAGALEQIAVVRQAALHRVKELERQRKGLELELEFYAGDPSKVPPSLKRLIDENDQSMAVQQRFIADQNAEMARVSSRFDEELARLEQLWARAGTSAK